MSEHQSSGFFDGSPKTMYFFGLVSGMALVLLINSFTGVGFAADANIGNNSGRTVAAVDTTKTPTATAPTATAPAGELAPVAADEHIRGDIDNAKVVIVEYSDFECPFCERHHPTMQQIFDTYGDDVAWVYRHFPLSFHPEAEPAALASECAAEQGKFWEFADALFINQDKLAATYYPELARELGLNVSQFENCVATGKYDAVVAADAASGSTAGVQGTPATFVNGQLVSGAVPFSQFKTLIDAELAK